jgi:VCBS repeat-containing protein
MKTLKKSRAADRRRQYERRSFLRLERLEDRMVLSGASPVAVNDLYQSMIDQPLAIDAAAGVLANDTDAEADALTANLFSGPANGSVTLNADGSFNYTPNAGFTGVDSFVYYANDGETNSMLAAVTLEVSGQGTAPVAADDSYNVAEDGALNTGFSDGVLGNDVDAEGNSLSATLVTGPTNGTLALNEDGSFTYIPNADFAGSDSFTYTASDGASDSNVATVTITVDPVNDNPVAANDVFSAAEDEALDSTAGSVLANDSDIDGDTLTAELESGPLHGTLTLNPDGTFSYAPEANFNGLDGFSYLASDGTGTSEVVTVTITVNPVNDAPVAAGDEYSVDEDSPLAIDAAAGVLADDSDIDGDALTAAVVSGPANGTLTLNADGSFSYTPNADFNGSDSFTYSASDGEATAEATVNITVNPVNDAPASVNDAYATDEDTPLTIPAPGVLTNDTDVDGDPLSVSILNQPEHGSVTLNADGSFTYTPEADFHGIDGFSYLTSDGTAESEAATATITVNPVNDAPVGAADEYATDEDATLNVDAAAGVLANDSDLDGDELSAAVVTGPANGTLTLNSDGSFSYAPNADFNGSDSFTYSVSDGDASSEATVTITVNSVNDAPVATADEYAANEDEALEIDAVAGVLANDTDADGDPLTATVVTGPANGTLTLNADGSFSYMPNAEFSGSDSFTYSASDGTASSETTVTINVAAVNDAPSAAADEYATDEDVELTVDAAAGVLANDSDLEGDPLSAVLVTGPAHGELTLNADGSFSYVPEADFFGTDSFVYQASDGTGTSEATATIIVSEVQEIPVVSDDAYSSGEDLTLSVDAEMGVLANDFDLEGGELSAALVTGPEHGELTLNADGSFSYLPEANWHGADSFVYEATTTGGGTIQAEATIVIEPLNDWPVAVDDEFDVEGGELSENVLTSDSDVDGDALTARLVRGPAHGELTLNPDGTFHYVADEGFTGDDCFSYQANDGKSNSRVALVTLHVAAGEENQLPASGEDAYTVESGQTLTVATPGVLANDSDAEGDPLTAELVDGPAHGLLVLNPDGSFSYTPESGFTGSDSFTYQANDGQGAGNVATVELTVTPQGTTIPIAAGDDAYEVAAETPLTVELPGVLANDIDAEGDGLSAAMVEGPTNGTVALAADGSFVYTPAIGFAGTDSFTYQASDGTNLSNIATVTIEVGSLDNTRPAASNDSYTAQADTTLDVLPDEGVLADDSDPDGDPITAELFSNPLHGTVTLAEDGSFSYTPNAGFVGLDSFVYWVFDGELHSALAAVTIHVMPGEDPGEVPPPGNGGGGGGGGCGSLAMSIDLGEGEDDLLDALADPDLDQDALDDLLGDGGWLA